MTMLDRVRRALVIAPHPDDEVLGCGGTIARLVGMGREVHVAIVTRGGPPRYAAADVEQVIAETRAAQLKLGYSHSHLLGLPAAELDQIPHATLNAAIGKLVGDIGPDTLFVPFGGDIHLDHQLVFTSALVAARPRSVGTPARVLAYETLSETNWYAPGITPAFCPNVFVDIAGQLETKLAAFTAYASQVQPPPGERSVEAVRALAVLRGATSFRAAAEAFMLIREIG